MASFLKNTMMQMKVNGVLLDIAIITDTQSVVCEFNEDGTIKTNLKDYLKNIVQQIEAKATSGDIDTACENLYKRIMGLTDADTTINETYDTLVEIERWITSHGEQATGLVQSVNTLETDMESVKQDIDNLKKKPAGSTVEASNVNGNLKVNGEEVKVYTNPGRDVYVATSDEEETAAIQKMRDGDILFKVVPVGTETTNTNTEQENTSSSGPVEIEEPVDINGGYIAPDGGK